MLCRELVTYKKHELWFVFARRPLRFSLQEFHAVTGLECDPSIPLPEENDWEDDGGFWSKVIKKKQPISFSALWKNHKDEVKKWRNLDRVRLIYLSIIVCVVLARDEKANIPIKYVKVVMDVEKIRKYPWGVAAFDLLVDAVAKTRDKLKEKTTSYVLDGFSYALQIWAMEAVPKIGKLLGKKLDKTFIGGPRCINWIGAAKVSYENINDLENIFTREDVSYGYISLTGNMDIYEILPFYRSDEVRDERVDRLHSLVRKGHDFHDHIWEHEDSGEVPLEVDDDETENDEEYQTPKTSLQVGTGSKKGKKRIPDTGMEKRKHKVLSSGRPKQLHFDEDMKSFMSSLFDQKFSALEQRLEQHIDARFEKIESQLKEAHKVLKK